MLAAGGVGETFRAYAVGVALQSGVRGRITGIAELT